MMDYQERGVPIHLFPDQISISANLKKKFVFSPHAMYCEDKFIPALERILPRVFGKAFMLMKVRHKNFGAYYATARKLNSHRRFCTSFSAPTSSVATKDMTSQTSRDVRLYSFVLSQTPPTPTTHISAPTIVRLSLPASVSPGSETELSAHDTEQDEKIRSLKSELDQMQSSQTILEKQNKQLQEKLQKCAKMTQELKQDLTTNATKCKIPDDVLRTPKLVNVMNNELAVLGIL